MGRSRKPYAKVVQKDQAYEVWTMSQFGGPMPAEGLLPMVQRDTNCWTWYVLKKYQADDSEPHAQWFCLVVTPITPRGELSNVYADDIKRSTWRVK
jgi:hypothetical protein